MKIYHNHIPRTGGNYLRDVVYYSLNPKMHIRHPDYFYKSLSLSDLDCDFISGHFGIEPLMLDPSIKSFTLLRNPINRLVSHFSVNKYYFNSKEEYDGLSEYEVFKKWINNEEEMISKSNFQARYLTNGLDNSIEELIVLDRKNETKEEMDRLHDITMVHGWGITKNEPTYEEALDSLNNMIAFGATENEDNFASRLISKINDLMDTNHELKNPFGFKNEEPSSIVLLEQLTEDDIRVISSYNQIDFKLWDYVMSCDNA